MPSKAKPLTNITCSQCSRPLFAVTELAPGQFKVQSFGCAVLPQPQGPHLAVCPKCGHQEPVDRRFIPSPS